MGAAQPFISGAITKTVNVPKDATRRGDQQAYIESWKLGAKAVSIYRDGSKRTQPLNTSKDKTRGRDRGAGGRGAGHQPGPPQAARRAPGDHAQVRHRRPRGLHHRRPVRGRHSPARSSWSMAKEGSTISGFADAFAQAISYALQYGVPLQALVDKFSHVRFEPSGMTQEPGDPLREVDRRLHLPVDGVEVPVARGAVPRRREQPRGDASRRPSSCRSTSPPPRARRPPARSASRTTVVVRGDSEPGRRAAVLDVRLDHDPQRRLLQVRNCGTTSGCA